MSPIVTVSIIIHQDYSHIRTALRSLIEGTELPIEIHVTLNTGHSDEAETLQRDFPQCIYHFNQVSRGFATNHNAIMRLSRTPYTALINDDTEAAPGMLDILIRYLNEHPGVGLVTPRVINPDGTPQLTAFDDPTLLRMVYKVSGLGYLTRHGSWARNFATQRGFQPFINNASLMSNNFTHEVPVAVGVAMIVRREAYLNAGMMDEDTLVYGEEVAWHWRLRQAGWHIVVVAETFIKHYNLEQRLHGWQLAEHRKGMLNYFCRYRPSWQAWVLRIFIIFFHGIRGIGNTLLNPNAAKGDWMSVQVALTWWPESGL